MKQIIFPSRNVKKIMFDLSTMQADRTGLGTQRFPITLWAVGLQGSETVKIQFPVVENPQSANDDHWMDLISGGEVVRLDVYNNHGSVCTPSIIRVVKSNTKALVSVFMVG